MSHRLKRLKNLRGMAGVAGLPQPSNINGCDNATPPKSPAETVIVPWGDLRRCRTAKEQAELFARIEAAGFKPLEVLPGGIRVAPIPRGRYVYFVEVAGFIKIGIATNWHTRLEGLQTANPLPLTVLAVFAGSGADERRLHKQFAKFRTRGEWFTDCAEIRAYIAARISGDVLLGKSHTQRLIEGAR